VYLKKYQKMLK